MTIKRWAVSLTLLLIAACSAAPDEALPTLVRYPTLAATQPADSAAQVVTVDRTFPATFTPTHTLTPTPTVSVTTTVTVTPSATITVTASPTNTALPTIPPENRPLLSFALTAAASTVLPDDYVIPDFPGINVTLPPPTASSPSTGTGLIGMATPVTPVVDTCPALPAGNFSVIHANNPDVAARLGCVTGTIQQVPAAWQNFEQGVMVWLNGTILVLYAPNDRYQQLPDTFIEGVDPETSSETPPEGLLAPIRGFLKVWSGNSVVRNGLGWATSAEQGTTAAVLTFANGQMVYLPGRNNVFVLYGSSSGDWVAYRGDV